MNLALAEGDDKGGNHPPTLGSRQRVLEPRGRALEIGKIEGRTRSSSSDSTCFDLLVSRHAPSTSGFGLLVLTLLVGLAGMIVFGGRTPGEPGERVEGTRGPTVDPSSLEASRPREVMLDPVRCADAGYLCSGLAEREEPRILRWSDETPVIRVGLPLPEGVEPARAREIQAAAAAGILTWQDKPFRIEIERGPRASSPDFGVRWVAHLEGPQLGRADTRWFREPDGRVGMQVEDFVLVHRDPFDREQALATRKIQLAAAHEMGHALGLPHSDSDRDVMFPTNTARTLSVRDYATMAALYSLENGALVPSPFSPP